MGADTLGGLMTGLRSLAKCFGSEVMEVSSIDELIHVLKQIYVLCIFKEPGRATKFFSSVCHTASHVRLI